MNNDQLSSAESSNLQSLLDGQRAAHRLDPYPSLAVRTDRINRLIDVVVANQHALVDAVMADFENRSPMATRSTDLMPTLDNLKYVRKNLKHWMKPEKRKSKFPLGLLGASSKVEYLPMGVVGNISPWNFPVQLSLSPIADIFGAGNRVMLKPSELTPETSKLMAAMIESSFDKTELAVVLGGPDVAEQFSKLKFDHLLFTGSTNIARLVAQSSAANLIPLTLELGGKNPVVISTSADIELAAEKLVWTKTVNSGQICLCPDRVFVPEPLLQKFIVACQAAFKKLYPNAAQDPEYTHVITQRHADRLRAMAVEAEQHGAQVIPLLPGENHGRRVFPSLVINADSQSRISQEEVFGPLLGVESYTNLQQVVTEINHNPRPLALYYFGNDRQEIAKLTHETVSGGMVVNDLMAHILQDDLPFGGVGDSGMGCYHGYDGFKNFSHAKAVFKQSRFDPLKILRPPYGKMIVKGVAAQIKR